MKKPKINKYLPKWDVFLSVHCLKCTKNRFSLDLTVYNNGNNGQISKPCTYSCSASLNLLEWKFCFMFYAPSIFNGFSNRQFTLKMTTQNAILKVKTRPSIGEDNLTIWRKSLKNYDCESAPSKKIVLVVFHFSL